MGEQENKTTYRTPFFWRWLWPVCVFSLLLINITTVFDSIAKHEIIIIVSSSITTVLLLMLSFTCFRQITRLTVSGESISAHSLSQGHALSINDINKVALKRHILVDIDEVLIIAPMKKIDVILQHNDYLDLTKRLASINPEIAVEDYQKW